MSSFTLADAKASPEIRRLVVLGHNGFIGTRLWKAFSACHPNVELVGLALDRLDLTMPSAAEPLARQFDRATAVVVLAGIKKQLGDTADSFEQNLAIASTTCLALRTRPVQRIVFFSSAEVYGEQTDDPSMTEATPVRPTSYYGIAKFASEGLFRKTALETQASLVILRPPLVYGPGDVSASYGPSGFSRAVVRGEPITMWGDGRERREFVFVDDIVEVARRLVFSRTHGVINVSAARSMSFRDVLDELERLVGRPIAVDSRARSRPSVDQGYQNSRLLAALPDLAFTSLEKGLRQVVAAELLSAGLPSGSR